MQLAEGYQLKNIIEGCVEIEQLYVIDPVFSIDYSWLGALFLSHYVLAVKRFLL
jgi:hypothetical protein